MNTRITDKRQLAGNTRVLSGISLALAIAFAALPVSKVQAVDPSFAYQGVLKSADGRTAITGNQKITFRLYKSPTEDEVLWARRISVLLDDNGLFNVMLGQSNGEVVAPDTDLAQVLKDNDGHSLYIGLTVDNSTGEIHPRQQILSVPYAAVAGDVSSASGTFTVDKEFYVKSGAEVKGESEFKAKVRITGKDSSNVGLDVSGNTKIGGYTTLSGGLEVAKEASFKEKLKVYRGSTTDDALDIKGKSYFDGAVTVKSGGITLSKGGLVISDVSTGTSSIKALNVDGDLTIGSTTWPKTLRLNGDVIPAPVKGMIILWYGSESSVPSGWKICDGNTYNGVKTPNLKGKFVVGANPSDSDFTQGKTGGEKTVTLTTAQIPSHYHTYYSDDNLSGRATVDDSTALDFNWDNGSGKNGKKYRTNSVGSGQSHNNLPPYMALFYIMYVGF